MYFTCTVHVQYTYFTCTVYVQVFLRTNCTYDIDLMLSCESNLETHNDACKSSMQAAKVSARSVFFIFFSVEEPDSSLPQHYFKSSSEFHNALLQATSEYIELTW